MNATTPHYGGCLGPLAMVVLVAFAAWAFGWADDGRTAARIGFTALGAWMLLVVALFALAAVLRAWARFLHRRAARRGW